MPLLLGPLLAFALGVAFAFAFGEAGTLLDLARARRAVDLFALLALAPALAYAIWALPDWSVGYVLDGAALPSAAGLVAVAAVAALVRVGFELARRALADGHARVGLGLGFGAALVATIVLASVGSRFGRIGTFAELHGGFPMTAIASSARGVAALSITALSGVAAWFTAGALRPTPASIAPRDRVEPRTGRGR